LVFGDIGEIRFWNISRDEDQRSKQSRLAGSNLSWWVDDPYEVSLELINVPEDNNATSFGAFRSAEARVEVSRV
jgi:hypothetical protein